MTTCALPTSWRQTTLGEIASPVPNAIVDGPFGSNLKLSDYVDEGVPVLQGKNITNDSFRWFDVRFISDRKAAELKRSSVRVGDILIIKIGSIGYSAIVDDLNGFDFAIIPANLAKVTPDATKIDLGYLHKWLTSVDAKRYFVGAASKTAQPALSLGKIKSLPLPLPPLAEQRRIAEVLDRAEALRAKRRAALAQLDSLTQSIFLDLFGDVAKNDRNWPSERMEDLMKIRRGGSPRPIENYLGGDINWIKIGDGTQGSDIYLERCADKIISDGLKKTVFLKAGSLIFANCGVSLGFARILKIDGCIHDGWLSFEEIPESKLDKLFLLKALNSITEHFRRIAPSGTQPNLNTGLMKNFRIILPPVTLQREFARRLIAAEKLKTAQRTSLAELDALFASLQYRAFRGELW